MYFVYSKTPFEEKFWELNNVKIYGAYDNAVNAEKIQKELAHNYVHQQSESNYKLREEGSILVVSRTDTVIVKGYLYNGTETKKTDIISFHVVYVSGKMDLNTEVVIEKNQPRSQDMINVLEQLKEKLQRKFLENE